MQPFVNEYKHTKAVISEVMAAWWGSKFRSGYIIVSICAMLGLILFLLNREFIFLILALMLILVIVLFKVKEKQAVKLELERQEVIFKNTIPTIRIEIGEDIHTITDKSEKRVSFSDVKKVVETKNLIVLFTKGSMTVALDKKGFISGNADECMDYLKKHI